MQSLLNSGSLPSAWGTRQRPNCTRQSLCRVRYSAKTTRQKSDRQSTLCRVSFIGHSAKKSDRHGGGSVDGHFAECQPCRHSANIFFLKKISLPSANPEGTRQRAFIFFEKFLCWVPTLQALGKEFLFFLKKILCRVPTHKALGKDFLFFLKKILCRVPSIRPSAKMFYYYFLKILCRVPFGRHSAKFDFF